jgi:hypothetical protein
VALPLLLLALVIAAPAAPAGLAREENLFRGPARCVLDYLEAVRLAGPRGRTLPRGSGRSLQQDYHAARALTAPRALAEVDRRVAAGHDSPLAPWLGAARGVVLESFSLLEVRRAPRGAAVVTVRERVRREGESTLGVTVSEYLVARVGGDWKVVDRRVGARLQDREIAEGYDGWFDRPAAASARR